jgi:hypothetical protein
VARKSKSPCRLPKPWAPGLLDCEPPRRTRAGIDRDETALGLGSISDRHTAWMHAKRKRPLHDISGVNTKDLVGKHCEIVVEHTITEDGSEFANIECKPFKGKETWGVPLSETVFFSLHPDEFREEDLKEVTDRQREKIKASETYKTLIEDLKFGAASKDKSTTDTIDDDFPENLGGAKRKKRAA